MRHIGIDTLWLQDQRARARLPLVKCPGTNNPADMMTKYLGAKESWKYVDFLKISQRSGRASAAAELHAVTGTPPTFTYEDPDAPLIIYPNGDTSRDVWECRGAGGVWKRRHRRSRQSLFTPHRVSRAPPKNARIGMRRRTAGKFDDDGEIFTFEDEWSTKELRHKMLSRSWTGTTEFFVEESDPGVTP